MTFTCAAEDCTQTANKLQCPICLKTGFSPEKSHFCSQECFKASWPTHKLLHLSTSAASSIQNASKYAPWPSFKFTGTLRPYPYGPARTVPSSIQKPDYALAGIPIGELDIRNKAATTIPILKKDEIEKMKTVCKLAREVLDEAAEAVAVGVTADEIDRIVHEACLKRGAYPSPLNYHGFPRSCCISVNEVICHGIPDQRPFAEGDIVNVDVTLYYDGYHGDLNETYIVGQTDEQSSKLVKCSRECLQEAIKAVRPGIPFKDLGAIIEKHARSYGFSVVRGFCGHGIGQLFHGPPSVPHYAKNRAVGIMKAGQVFTIEPMINVGAWQDLLWPDNWTAVTVDGKRSAQFEHTLLVTETGCEILTASRKESRFVVNGEAV